MATREALLGLCVLCLLATRALALGTEQFGNEPLNPRNYPEKLVPLANYSSRVYHRWINGGESFLYRGDTESLNGYLAAFAQTNEPRHRLLLQPGLGHGRSFENQDVLFVWSMEFAGGVMKRIAQENLGEFVLFESPTVTIHIDGIKLDELAIPAGVEIVSPARRAREVAKAARDSTSPTIRVLAIGLLPELNPYERDHVVLIVNCLAEKDPVIQHAAARGLRRFGASAVDRLPQLRMLAKGLRDVDSRQQLDDSIAIIEKDQPDERKKERFLEQLQRIENFVAGRDRKAGS